MLPVPEGHLYGEGITNYFFYNQHMTITGRLPPAFIVTATIVAKGVGSNSGDSTDDEIIDIYFSYN